MHSAEYLAFFLEKNKNKNKRLNSSVNNKIHHELAILHVLTQDYTFQYSITENRKSLCLWSYPNFDILNIYSYGTSNTAEYVPAFMVLEYIHLQDFSGVYYILILLRNKSSLIIWIYRKLLCEVMLFLTIQCWRLHLFDPLGAFITINKVHYYKLQWPFKLTN